MRRGISMMRQFRVVTKPAVVSLLKSQIRRMEDRVSRYQLIIGKVQSNFSQHGAIQTTITILKTNIRATCVQKMGSVVPVVQELRPVEVEKRAIFRLRCQFMSKLSITVLHKTSAFFGTSFGSKSISNKDILSNLVSFSYFFNALSGKN